MKDNKMYWPYDVYFRIKHEKNTDEWTVIKCFPNGKEQEVYRCDDPARCLVEFDRIKEEYRKEQEEKK